MSETTRLSPDRVRGIGGSEAAAVLGLSKWKTPYQVYCDKLGLSGERDSTEAQEWGTILEPVIRQQYANRTGRTVRDPGHIQSEEYPFMLCTPDGVTDCRRVVEIKTSRYGDDWGEEGTDEIPTPYLIQCQHNLFVARMEIADVPVLIGGNDFRIYEVPADPEIQQTITEKEAAFWAMVEAQTPPPPITYADAVRRWAASVAKQVIATPEVLTAVEVLRELKTSGKAAEVREEEARFAVLLALGEADTLVDAEGKVLITFKQTKDRISFDVKAFQAAHPEIYQAFCVTKTGSRQFLVKGQKEAPQ